MYKSGLTVAYESPKPRSEFFSSRLYNATSFYNSTYSSFKIIFDFLVPRKGIHILYATNL